MEKIYKRFVWIDIETFSNFAYKETIIIAFAIVFGGIVLALAIAFGLGGRDMAKEYLEKKMKGEEKDEIEHI